MKKIEIDDELYQYIVKNTEQIGESASSILRRLLGLTPERTAESITIKNNIIDDEPDSTTAINELNTTPNFPVETVTNKTASYLFNYINKEELAMQRGAVGRFLLILAALYRVHQDEFSVVNEIRGKGRLYFATNADDLEASGSSTKPKQIAQSPYWVITNTNTTRKKLMLTEVAERLGYSAADAEKIRELL